MPQLASLLHPVFKIQTLAIFLVMNAAIIALLSRKHLNRKYSLDYKVQQLQEDINIINEQIDRENRVKSAQEARILRYLSLKKLIEEINQEFDPEATAEQLLAAAFSLVADKKGVCLMYLVDKHDQKPILFKVKKEDRRLVIKDKEGDMFDNWVMRHNAPLFVEDVFKDFRFDIGKVEQQEHRPLASLISAPILTDQGLVGLLRLEHHEPGYYSQDDLRLLSTICDLGAVTLESSELYQKMEELANHDSLTSFLTRGYFVEALKDEVKRSSRSKTQFSLLLADLDYFKLYNDRFGHTAGDEVLRILSRIFKDELAEFNPVIGRYGGEEFCIILPGVAKPKALEIAGNLRKKVEKEKVVLRRQETNITISIGIAVFPDDAADDMDLIRKSDAAMYRAKEKGRNQVCSI
jgi:diguanylate cyclase (GGDEF)-like protein